MWRVTERCDLACAFCAYDRRLRRPRRDLDPAEARRFGALAADWARARGRELLVSWLGGEPFLWRPLADVTRHLRERGARVSLTSNGRALRHAGQRAFAAEHLDELTLSLDGPPAVHDALRGAGSAEIVLDALRDLAARNPRPVLRVNTVLMRDNLAAFGELARLVAEAGADELTFNALGGRDRPEFFRHHRLAPDDIAALRAALPDARRHLRIRGGDDYLHRLAASAAGRALPVADCRAAEDFWFVEVDGRLSACSYTSELGVRVADLVKHADLDQLATPRAPICDDCPSTHVHRKFA